MGAGAGAGFDSLQNPHDDGHFLPTLDLFGLHHLLKRFCFCILEIPSSSIHEQSRIDPSKILNLKDLTSSQSSPDEVDGAGAGFDSLQNPHDDGHLLPTLDLFGLHHLSKRFCFCLLEIPSSTIHEQRCNEPSKILNLKLPVSLQSSPDGAGAGFDSLQNPHADGHLLPTLALFGLHHLLKRFCFCLSEIPSSTIHEQRWNEPSKILNLKLPVSLQTLSVGITKQLLRSSDLRLIMSRIRHLDVYFFL